MAGVAPSAMAEQARRLLQTKDVARDVAVAQMQTLLQEATARGEIANVLEQRDEQGKTLLMLAAAADQQEMAVQVSVLSAR